MVGHSLRNTFDLLIYLSLLIMKNVNIEIIKATRLHKCKICMQYVLYSM